jgi:hypothetical protein
MKDKEFDSFVKKTNYGIHPQRAEKEVMENSYLEEVKQKIDDYIIKWNGGKKIEKPITHKEANHLLMKFWFDKPIT